MDYKGAGVRLQPGELKELSEEFGLTEAHTKTVIQVETAGKGFNSAGWVEFLFEPHIFYRNCPKDKLATAIQQGLAYPTWRGPGTYPKSVQLRIQQFQKAAALDETAAIKSASWGLGQIMGSECLEAGYPTPQDMLAAFAESEANQVKGMLSLIHHRKIDKDLLAFPDMTACRHFAKIYNGAAYERNNYHVKLHDAFIRNRGAAAERPTLDPLADGTLSFGEKDDRVDGPIRKMQNRFKELGYSLKIDGDFGGGTRTTVLAWKANEGMDTSSANMSAADLELLYHHAQIMPVPQERANATVEDLKPSSSIIQTTSLGQKILGWLGLGTGGATLAQSTGVLDSLQNNLDKVDQAKSVTSQITSTLGLGMVDIFKFAYEWRFLILLIAVGIGFYYFRYIRDKRVEMHQKAEIA